VLVEDLVDPCRRARDFADIGPLVERRRLRTLGLMREMRLVRSQSVVAPPEHLTMSSGQSAAARGEEADDVQPQVYGGGAPGRDRDAGVLLVGAGGARRLHRSLAEGRAGAPCA
jgi:hypothetical protein